MSQAPVTAAGVQVPADPESPIVLDFGTHALRIAVVAKSNIKNLPEQEWGKPGVYVLLGPPGDARTEVYVGKAVSLRSRLNHHRRAPKMRWWRAVAVVRDTTNGFNSAEIGYLEGRLSRQLTALPVVSLRAGREDMDETLPDHLLISLDAFVPTILAALRLAGLDTSRPQPAEKPERTRGRTVHSATVGDLVAAGLIRPGEKLIFERRGRHGEAVLNPAGEIVMGGVSYATLSAAGSALLDGKSVNGWKAWRVGESGPTLSALRSQLGST